MLLDFDDNDPRVELRNPTARRPYSLLFMTYDRSGPLPSCVAAYFSAQFLAETSGKIVLACTTSSCGVASSPSECKWLPQIAAAESMALRRLLPPRRGLGVYTLREVGGRGSLTGAGLRRRKVDALLGIYEGEEIYAASASAFHRLVRAAHISAGGYAQHLLKLDPICCSQCGSVLVNASVHAPAAGMHLINDPRATGLSSNCKLLPDGECRVLTGVVIPAARSDLAFESYVFSELLADYGSDFWATFDKQASS